MTGITYPKSERYTNLDTIYEQCSGPGGLQLAEFMAAKMGLVPGRKLLDVGSNRGWQSCFLAREYSVFVVGIDPWNDRMESDPMVDHLRKNAHLWNVENSVLGIQTGVPDTHFASDSFDYIYSTDALQMVRVSLGSEGYLKSLKELYRILKPGGICGLGEPMHLDVSIPPDLEPYVSKGEFSWKKCFRNLAETEEFISLAGFEIIESGYAPDARQWWMDYARHDPFCKQNPEEDPRTLEVDDGRWASFGYVIGTKP